jgi:phage gpG-like protein
MPAVSKAQQQAAAIAEHEPSKAKGAAKQMAKSMSKEQLHHFAATKVKDKPEHKEEKKASIRAVLYKRAAAIKKAKDKDEDTKKAIRKVLKHTGKTLLRSGDLIEELEDDKEEKKATATGQAANLFQAPGHLSNALAYVGRGLTNLVSGVKPAPGSRTPASFLASFHGQQLNPTTQVLVDRASKLHNAQRNLGGFAVGAPLAAYELGSSGERR